MKFTTSFLISLFLLATIITALPQPLQRKSPSYTLSLTSASTISLSRPHSHAQGYTHLSPLAIRGKVAHKIEIIIVIVVLLAAIALGGYLYYHWWMFKKVNQVPLAAAKAAWGMRKG